MKKILLTLCLAVAMMFAVVPVWANSYNLTLGDANISPAELAGYTGGYGTVGIDASGQVTFTGVNDVFFNGHAFDIWFTGAGVNVTTGGTTPTIITPATWVVGGTGNIDGFGRFNVQVDPAGSQGAGAAASLVQFSLGGPVTLGFNNNGYLAAAHIVVFMDNSTSALTTGMVANGNPSQVPEPMTLLLLGLGLVGVAGARRMLKK